MVFTGEDDEFRISIRNKVTGSRLLFRELLTSDSGDYRCEASNGVMRIVATAKLKVSFSKIYSLLSTCFGYFGFRGHIFLPLFILIF